MLIVVCSSTSWFAELVRLCCQLGYISVEIPTHVNERFTEVQP